MTQHVVKGTIQMCYMIKVGCSDIIQLKAIQDRNSSVQVINGDYQGLLVLQGRSIAKNLNKVA